MLQPLAPTTATSKNQPRGSYVLNLFIAAPPLKPKIVGLSTDPTKLLFSTVDRDPLGPGSLSLR